MACLASLTRSFAQRALNRFSMTARATTILKMVMRSGENRPRCLTTFSIPRATDCTDPEPSVECGSLPSGSETPRREFLLAHPIQLTLGLFAAGHGQNLFENLLAHLFDGRPFQNHARVDVHVINHVVVQGRIRGDLDGGSR